MEFTCLQVKFKYLNCYVPPLQSALTQHPSLLTITPWPFLCSVIRIISYGRLSNPFQTFPSSPPYSCRQRYYHVLEWLIGRVFGLDDWIYCTLYIRNSGLQVIQSYRWFTHFIQFSVTHVLVSKYFVIIEFHHLKYDVWSCESQPTFRVNMSPTSSGETNKPSKEAVWNWQQAHNGPLSRLPYDSPPPERSIKELQTLPQKALTLNTAAGMFFETLEIYFNSSRAIFPKGEVTRKVEFR
jgi:hypothetical protein